MSFFNELNRRNVLRVGAAYIVTSWLLIQVAETIFPLFGFGDDPARLIVILLAIGFVPVLIFSWAFEWTPQGFKRDGDIDLEQSHTPQTGKKLDRIIMLVLALALGYFAFDKFVLAPQREQVLTEAAAEAAVEQVHEEARLDMFNDKSIAVLPFTNRSEQKEDEYFTDGMHDELLTRLSRISEMKVISRTSVMHYRDTSKTIPEIAKELSVATILEGGVQRAGNQVRINVQLIDARTDEHLWAEIYDRELTTDNLFAIQSEISETIAMSLHATLSPEERERIFDMPTDNLEAYNHYLRGRQLVATRKKEEMLLGFEEFTRATELDSNFALAWVGIADTINLLHFIGAFHERDKQLELRQDAVDKALAINDQLGEAYASLAMIYRSKFESDKAKAAFIKAIELNPNYAQAFLWYSFTKMAMDEQDERLRLIYKAAELDPLSSNIQSNLAGTLMWGNASADTEHNQEGRKVIMKLLERDPEFASGYRMLGNFQADWGQLANAVRNYRKALELDPGNARTLASLALLYVSLGDLDAFEATRRELEINTSPYQSERLKIEFESLGAQARWDEAQEFLADLPEEAPDGWRHPWRSTLTYYYARKFDKALESLLTWQPEVLDPESWQEGLGGTSDSSCFYAGIFIGAGEEEKGRELLQIIIGNLNAMSDEERSLKIYTRNVIECYLVNKEYDRALTVVETSLSHSSQVQDWYQWRHIPWWESLEDNPRYQAMVARIEGMIAEQRTLLKEMEASGTDIP